VAAVGGDLEGWTDLTVVGGAEGFKSGRLGGDGGAS
jgi:hypothetical protein